MVAGKNEGAAGFAFVIYGGGNLLGRFVPQIPGELIQSSFCRNVLLRFISFPLVGATFFFLFFAVESASNFALGVQQLQLDGSFGLVFQTVRQCRHSARICASTRSAASAIPPAPPGSVS